MWLLIGKWMIAIGLIVGSIIEETIYKKRLQTRKTQQS